jgi:hypothetical protein
MTTSSTGRDTAIIQVRGVSIDVRDTLARRAEQAGQSLQKYVLTQLEQFARTPTIDEWLDANDNATYRVDLTNIDVAELIARDRR